MESSEKTTVCCPPFDPTLWNDTFFEWNNKRFIKDKVVSLFFMPLNFGQVMRRLDKKVSAAGASVPDNLCLSDHGSQWKMDLLLAVDKEIPEAENIVLTGKYYCLTYEGNFKDSGKWCKDFEKQAKSKGLQTDKLYMWYTTCPKCANKYGKNHVAIFSKVG